MDIEYYMFTDKGGREINEDCVKTASYGDSYCFVLCDGLGGHGRGEVASALVAESIAQRFAANGDSDTFIETALDEAQEKLLSEQKRLHAPMEMKTTATVLTINGGEYKIGHIGDSRVYVFRKNKVLSRTLDHSVPQMLVLAGDIKEKHIRRHPDRNRLLRVMGVEWDSPRYEISESGTLKKGDAFLLCTDGFWEPITEKEMSKALKSSKSAEEWTAKMTELIRKNADLADMDNFSAVTVRI